MIASSIRRRLARRQIGATCLLFAASVALPAALHAQVVSTTATPNPQQPDAARQPPPAATGNGVFGDWAGLKPALSARGVDVVGNYTFQPAANIDGGERRTVRQAGQLLLSANIDFDKLAGLRGGTGRLSFTLRHGRDLTSAADLGAVQQVVEIYGRGNMVRITDAWYAQQLGAVNLKAGRMMVGQDFATFSCDFLNLTFCGGQPGNIAGGYWINWPVSQWGSRIELQVDRRVQVKVGAYAVDKANLDHGFELRAPWHAQSVLVPVELRWQDETGPTHRKTSVRVGGWYESGRAPRLDRLASAAIDDVRRGHYGGFIAAEHEILRSGEGAATRHFDLFARVSVADARTSAIRAQATVGTILYGWTSDRPADWVGVALGLNRVNRSAVDRPSDSRPNDNEMLGEMFYNYRAASWLNLRPDVQYIHHPGGRPDGSDAVVIGAKINVDL